MRGRRRFESADFDVRMLAPDPRFVEIDEMDGTAFELALVELFEILGYDDVERIGGYDKGADIVIVKEGERTAVQAKRHSSGVRIDAVRQLVDGMRRYNCPRGLVVTNSFFTEPAVECAEAWGIDLWDRSMLSRFLEGDAPDVDQTVCAECGRSVTSGVTDWCVSRPARYGGNVYCRAHQARSRRSS